MTDDNPQKPDESHSFGDARARFTLGLAQLLALAGLATIVVAFFAGLTYRDELAYFFHSYLTQFCFFLSISLGALAFVLIQHVSRAGWSVTVRRVAELLAGNIPILAILFLPVIVPLVVGYTQLYPWADPGRVAGNHLLEHKTPYLNVPFFALRAAGCFVVWWLISRFYLRNSLRQDKLADPALTGKMERFSGPALILFGITVTVAATDWIMSLTPQWFSTIFGLYYFSGAIVGGIAVLALVVIGLQAVGRIGPEVHEEHYHDLGKLLFAFVIFWGYIAFSQYMLIWYANIPEETQWYLPRQSEPWTGVSLALLFGHLVIPFLGMLPRAVKRNPRMLAFWSVWMIVFHWLDVYYLVMPSLEYPRLPIGMMDVLLFLGLGAIFAAGVLRMAAGVALIPQGDPRLKESLAFENV